MLRWGVHAVFHTFCIASTLNYMANTFSPFTACPPPKTKIVGPDRAFGPKELQSHRAHYLPPKAVEQHLFGPCKQPLETKLLPLPSSHTRACEQVRPDVFPPPSYASSYLPENECIRPFPLQTSASPLEYNAFLGLPHTQPSDTLHILLIGKPFRRIHFPRTTVQCP